MLLDEESKKRHKKRKLSTMKKKRTLQPTLDMGKKSRSEKILLEEENGDQNDIFKRGKKSLSKHSSEDIFQRKGSFNALDLSRPKSKRKRRTQEILNSRRKRKELDILRRRQEQGLKYSMRLRRKKRVVNQRRLSVPFTKSWHYGGGFTKKTQYELFKMVEGWKRDMLGEIDFGDLLQDKMTGIILNSSTMEVVSGTENQIINFICLNDDLNASDIVVFTNPTFMKESDFIFKMCDIFKNTEEYFPGKEIDTIQNRVIGILLKWNHMNDKPNSSSLQIMSEFINYLDTIGYPPELFKGKTRSTKSTLIVESARFPPINRFSLTSGLKLLEIDVEEFTRQVSLLYQEYYFLLNNNNFMKIAKGKFPRPTKEIGDLAEKITNWYLSEILLEPKLKKRSKMFAVIIHLIESFLQKNNFQGAIDSYLALEHYLLAPLKKEWKKVKHDDIEKWEELKEIMTPLGSWKNVRKLYSECNPPCVFPAPIFQRDFILISENDDFIDGEKHQHNFFKRKILKDAMITVKKSLSKEYEYHLYEPLRDELLNLELVSDDILLSFHKSTIESAAKKKGRRKTGSSLFSKDKK